MFCSLLAHTQSVNSPLFLCVRALWFNTRSSAKCTNAFPALSLLGRPHHYGALSSGMDDAAAGQMVGLETLQDLGFDQAKGRAIFNCLSKLGRAQLQRANGGAVAYRLVGQGS